MIKWHKCNAIAATDRASPRGYEKPRFPDFVDYRLTDRVEVVNLRHRPPSQGMLLVLMCQSVK
jgi:hypothetical protein